MTLCNRVRSMMRVGVLALLVPTGALAQADNSLEVVIGNGPHAGSYKQTAAEIACYRWKPYKMFLIVYRDTNAKDEKTLSWAGINVFNAEGAEPPSGDGYIHFGDPDAQPHTTYDTFKSRPSLTFTTNHTMVEAQIDGQAKDGTKLRMTATCTVIKEIGEPK